MRTIRPDDLADAIGDELGTTDWHEITQDGVDAFADVTGDRFWLHVDPERAAASPFGTTIAHGLYTLSLEPMFRYTLVTFEGWPTAVNYGYNRVRFPAPVPVGSAVRMRSRVVSSRDVDGGAEVVLEQTFERRGHDTPVCVAEAVFRLID